MYAKVACGCKCRQPLLQLAIQPALTICKEDMHQLFKKTENSEGTRPKWLSPCLQGLHWPALTCLHTDLQEITKAVQSILLLQTFYNNTFSQKATITGLKDYRPSGSWEQQSPGTNNGTVMSAPSLKEPSRECISCTY